MGPVNWLAVVAAALVALAVDAAWGRFVLRSDRRMSPTGAGTLVTVLLLLLSSVMLGHNFARIGAETLALKPKLYFMQTGGVAVAFIMPAIWLSHARTRTEPMLRAQECLFWLVAYLAMGLVFWAMHA